MGKPRKPVVVPGKSPKIGERVIVVFKNGDRLHGRVNFVGSRLLTWVDDFGIEREGARNEIKEIISKDR